MALGLDIIMAKNQGVGATALTFRPEGSSIPKELGQGYCPFYFLIITHLVHASDGAPALLKIIHHIAHGA